MHRIKRLDYKYGFHQQKVENIKKRYKMTDFDMEMLFGTDMQIQKYLLRKYPHWQRAIEEMENII